jgi:Domain of unknown function (DUF3854)
MGMKRKAKKLTPERWEWERAKYTKEVLQQEKAQRETQSLFDHVPPAEEKLPALLQDHLVDLLKSDLSSDTIQTMGCYSVKRPADFNLQFDGTFLAFPYPDHPGYVRYRLYPPLEIDGSTIKYWQRPGSYPRLYILPAVKQVIGNPYTELYIPEGEKKAACLTQHLLHAIGIAGVWNWVEKGGVDLMHEFDLVAFANRPVRSSLTVTLGERKWNLSDKLSTPLLERLRIVGLSSLPL